MLLSVLHRRANCTSQPLHREGMRRRKKSFIFTSCVAVAVAVQHRSSGNQGSAKCLVCSLLHLDQSLLLGSYIHREKVLSDLSPAVLLAYLDREEGWTLSGSLDMHDKNIYLELFSCLQLLDSVQTKKKVFRFLDFCRTLS